MLDMAAGKFSVLWSRVTGFFNRCIRVDYEPATMCDICCREIKAEDVFAVSIT